MALHFCPSCNDERERDGERGQVSEGGRAAATPLVFVAAVVAAAARRSRLVAAIAVVAMSPHSLL